MCCSIMEVSIRSLYHIKIRDLLVAAKICRYLMCNEAAIHSRDFYTVSGIQYLCGSAQLFPLVQAAWV